MALLSSKYAPKTAAETAVLSRAERIKKDQETAQRLLYRLHWKAESLVSSYMRAKEIWFADPTQNGGMHHQGLTQYPFVLGMNAASTQTLA